MIFQPKKILNCSRFSSILLFGLFLFSLSGCFNDDSDFKIENSTEVDFVGIYGQDSVELIRKNGKWMLNEEMNPDPTAVDNFFYAFKNIDIAGATTGEDIDTLVSRKIIIREGRKSKDFRFYASPGYYLLNHEGSSKIFRVKVLSAPDANLEEIFSDNPTDWLEREFISIEPDDLQEIRVIPQPRFGKGFVMRRDSTDFRVFDLDGNELPQSHLVSEKTLLYASYLDQIYFSDEISEDSILQRINSDEPFYEFFIKEDDEAGYSFGVYELYTEEGEKDLFYGAVKYSGKKPVLKVNYANLDLLFQNLDYFTVE